MSCDLEVYVPRDVSSDEIERVIDEMSGLNVASTTSDQIVVCRGARRSVSFSVEGPVKVEPEDLPEAVIAVMLEPRRLFEVSVLGDADADITYAKRFARALATLGEGAAYDRQADTAWSRAKGRTVSAPEGGARVSMVEVNVYCRRDQLRSDPAQLYLDIARRYVPEALPRRYGDVEPFQGRLVEGGDIAFDAAWRDTSLIGLGFKCARPFIDGHLSPAQRETVFSLSLTLHREPLLDARWRDALRRTFCALADELPAFYATAEVERGVHWSGRSAWYDGYTEETISPARSGKGWYGLLPYPAWWSWYGPDYLPLVEACLPVTLKTKRGVLVEAAEEPADRDALSAVEAVQPPDDLLARYGRNRGRERPAPLKRARLIPEGLKRDR